MIEAPSSTFSDLTKNEPMCGESAFGNVTSATGQPAPYVRRIDLRSLHPRVPEQWLWELGRLVYDDELDELFDDNRTQR